MTKFTLISNGDLQLNTTTPIFALLSFVPCLKDPSTFSKYILKKKIHKSCTQAMLISPVCIISQMTRSFCVILQSGIVRACRAPMWTWTLLQTGSITPTPSLVAFQGTLKFCSVNVQTGLEGSGGEVRGINSYKSLITMQV